jgi:putative nucleotidyltransferase with HDIG domain
MDQIDVRDAVLRIRELPTLPAVLGKILMTTADPDASALDLGQLIACDPSLAATILKLVNSAYYGMSRQVGSVTQAIVMLGFIEIRKLVLATTAFHALSKETSKFDRTQLWRHSIGTAMIAERLAKAMKIRNEGCFEAGLLHDIGKVVFDVLYPQQFRAAAELAHENEWFTWQAEREVFGFDHAGAGALLAEHWNLPPAVVETIQFHHDSTGLQEYVQLASLIELANTLTYTINLGEWSNGAMPPVAVNAANRLNLTEDIYLGAIADLKDNPDKIDGFVGALG